MKENKPKQHHYIPEKILINFTDDGANHVFMIDKYNGTITPPLKVNKAAKQGYYYNYPENKGSLETVFFNIIDSNTPPVIKMILNKSKRPLFSRNDRSIINRYIASQICRVPAMQKFFLSMEESFQEAFSDKINKSTFLTKDPKSTFLDQIQKNTEHYSRMLDNKKLKILDLHHNKNYSFVIGDNPVICINNDNHIINILNLDLHSVIDYNIIIMPISYKCALIFHDGKSDSEIDFYINNLNDLQFYHSERFIFGKDEKILSKTLKNYHLLCHNIIEKMQPINPDLFIPKKGEPVVLLPPKLKLSNAVVDYINKKFPLGLNAYKKDNP
ncbi:TPA: DUF4238 domain-containing protein [Raoultella planticola]|uniref:DUF4238 domain-containing protein n=2 Tax=Klebsiella/Raoultella group TaxID=2890311 RepID=A0AAJ1NUR9_9ENTR|nr:DUF4238 domain-containing protein [Klebsiella michiganensis]MDH0966945.1 DUF4238 domain-containing protein [Klebsiella michiganensis]HED2546597.1 DUF4238 domain-containing protein [Raoultella planticola]HED2590604.1 DUF4238 domain-containing protein [Raoultella planticola]